MSSGKWVMKSLGKKRNDARELEPATPTKAKKYQKTGSASSVKARQTNSTQEDLPFPQITIQHLKRHQTFLPSTQNQPSNFFRPTSPMLAIRQRIRLRVERRNEYWETWKQLTEAPTKQYLNFAMVLLLKKPAKNGGGNNSLYRITTTPPSIPAHFPLQ